MAVKEKRGLGIGLDALFGTDLQALSAEEVLSLPISRIEPRQDQPRDRFDEERLQDLASSISLHGLIQPVIVRKLEQGSYQIIAGERRWRAARMAGLTEIPVRVLNADDRSVGKSRSAVANALRLLNLSAPVSAMVEEGTLSAGHARALLTLDSPALQKKAADQVVAKALSVRKTELLAARMKKEARISAEAAEKDGAGTEIDYAAVVSEELSSLYGRKIRLLEKKNAGKIELFYDSAEDREVLISLLRKLKEKD